MEELKGAIQVLEEDVKSASVLGQIIESGEQHEAFFLCDVGDILNNHMYFKALMPRVEPFYAIKCNDTPVVLKTLVALDLSFDCASKGEIQKLLALGVHPTRMIFANPTKPGAHISYAAENRVKLTTFDSEVELHKLKKLHPNAEAVIRIRCDAYETLCFLGTKFGCDPVEEAPRLLNAAKQLEINVVGVAFHVGSGCKETGAYARAVRQAKDVFVYAASIGYNFALLDIGGGFCFDTIDDIALIVNGALNDYFPDNSVRIIAEPGCFYTQTSFTLACNIHSIKHIDYHPISKKPERHVMYYIDDGTYGSFNIIPYYNEKVTPTPFKIKSKTRYANSSVWGPTCCGTDMICENELLPELRVDDWLVFKNMGAYTLPASSPFNGFANPKVHFVADKKTWKLLRDKEAFDGTSFVFGNSMSILRVGLE